LPATDGRWEILDDGRWMMEEGRGKRDAGMGVHDAGCFCGFSGLVD